MSLRSAEEGLTALSYPAVAYELDRGYGGPLTLIVGAVTGVTKMVTDTVTQFAIADQMKETSKQTRYTTEAQRDIAEQQARVAMAEAKAEVEIQQQYVLIEAERTRQLPFKIAGTVAGVAIFAFVADRIAARRGQGQVQRQSQSQSQSQSQRQRTPQRQQQRSL